MRRQRWSAEALAARANVSVFKIRDAIDYRSDLTCDELRRLAAALVLNEVGLCALGAGRYPHPEISALPFSVWPLRIPHGIGVANAYIVAETGSDRAILFDTGSGMAGLRQVWPAAIKRLDAVFLTHVEAEHAGGLCEVVEQFRVQQAFVPAGAVAPCGQPLAEGECQVFGSLAVTVFSTPGHAAAHSCYLVRSQACPQGDALLVSGDLVFAGSIGGAYFCPEKLQLNLRRMLGMVPPNTVVAPGHGPMTTVGNELRFNPFAV